MLHIVNKSPGERSALESCLAHARAGHSVLLIEDAVYAATKGHAAAARLREAIGRSVAVFVLAPDLEARARAGAVLEGVTSVDYRGFVDLVTGNPRVQSWL
ncbi:MAG: sulfurtransferase complex subunit TusB [Burkholderiales bacterium]